MQKCFVVLFPPLPWLICMGPTLLPAPEDILTDPNRPACHSDLFRVHRSKPISTCHAPGHRFIRSWSNQYWIWRLLLRIMRRKYVSAAGYHGVYMWSLGPLQPFCYHEEILPKNSVDTTEGRGQRWKETNSLKTLLSGRITPNLAWSGHQITPDLWTFQLCEQKFPFCI